MGSYSRTTKQLINNFTSTTFVNTNLMLANYATRTLYGKGVEFKAKDEKITEMWEEFYRRNRVGELLFQASKIASIRGYSVITINQDKEFNVYWNIANLLYNCAIGTSFVEEKVAVLYEAFILDNRQYIIKSTYDTKKVVRHLYNLAGEEVSVFDVNEKLPKDQQIPQVWNHNLGFCPVFVIYNRPFRRQRMTYGSILSNYIGDEPELWDEFSVSDIAAAPYHNELINQIYRTMYYELYASRTRVIGSNLPQYNYNRDKFGLEDFEEAQQNQEYAFLMSQFLIRNGDSDNSEITVMTSKDKIGEYMNAILEATEDFFRKCNYSIRAGGSAQKTAQESASEFYETIETTNLKRTTQTECIIRGIIKTFKVMKINLDEIKDEWSFQIRKNQIIDEASLRNNLIIEIQAGITTIPEAIAQIKNIDYNAAISVWEENKKWFEENEFSIQMKEGGGMSGVNGAPSGKAPKEEEKGGRPSKDENTKTSK